MIESLPTEKLQKVLASIGHGEPSRYRSLDRRRVEVSVNGRVAKLGDRVDEDDRIELSGKPVVRKPQRHRYLLVQQACQRDLFQEGSGRP